MNIKKTLFKLNAGVMAFMMMLTSGVLSSGIVNVFAADSTLSHDNATTVTKLQYDTPQTYIAENANEKVVTDIKDESTKEIKKDLKETNYSIRLKRLFGNKSDIPSNCSIHQLWSKYSDAVIAQYTDIISVYDIGDADYYVVNLADSKVNGLGNIYDTAWVKGITDTNPDVLNDIKADKSKGLAYIPKSYFEKDKDVLITGQTLYASNRNDSKTNIDAIIVNPNKETQQQKLSVKGSTYDVTTTVPITDSLKTARALSLDDFTVFLNGSETPYDLNGSEAASYNEDKGELELGVSPTGLTSIRIEIKKKNLAEKVSDFFTTSVSAKISNPSTLKYVKDKKSGDPIELDRIDTSVLADGQVYDYASSGGSGDDAWTMTNSFHQGGHGGDVWNDFTKAMQESLTYSLNFMYIPAGSDASDAKRVEAWEDLYKNGNDYKDVGGFDQHNSWSNVFFGVKLPGAAQKYKATCKTGKNAGTVLNFHQKGRLSGTYDGSYNQNHTYAAECAEISTASNDLGAIIGGKMRVSILSVEDNYVVLGFCAPSDGAQSAYAIYKYQISSTGSLSLKKESANTDATNGNNCYSLSGAKFGVYKTTTDAANKSNSIGTLTTKEDGSSNVINELAEGTYYVRETDAPKGYKVNDNVYSVKVDAKNDEDDPAMVTIKDEAKGDPLSFNIQKIDKEKGTSIAQGDADLSGTQFTVKYYNGLYDSKSKLPSTPTKTWVFESDSMTDKDGNVINKVDFDDNYKVSGDDLFKWSNGKVYCPYGTITIQETKASSSYKDANTVTSVNGKTEEDGIYLSQISDTIKPSDLVTSYVQSNEVKKYGLQVWKLDNELKDADGNNKSESNGGKDHTASEEGSTLEGTEFTIINRSKNPVKYQDKEIAVGDEVCKIYAKWNEELQKYTAQTGNEDLAYGTYGVKETKASTGYKMTDGKEYTYELHGENGHLYTPDDKDFETLAVPNQVIRGDYSFVKKDGNTQKSISAAFKVTNNTTGESHVIVTDKNGSYSSKDNREDSSDKTNEKFVNTNDSLIKEENGYTSDTVLKTSDFNYNEITWFGKGEDGTLAKYDSNKCAFTYGTYTVEELRTETNVGLKLVKFTFSIDKDNKEVPGGTINDWQDVTIGTTAKDATTNEHIGVPEKVTTIIDTVKYTGLDVGEKYKVVGTLMDKETGAAVTDADGKEITSTKEFTCEHANDEVEVTFEFDGRQLAGHDVVVFEKLYDADGVVKATHEKIDDEGQTVKYTELKTKVTDGVTNTNVTNPSKDITIVDTVEYKNLKVGTTYTITGTLMDKETGKEALDDNGDKITASTEFKAEKSNGTVEVTFKFSGVNTAGKTLVAFEEVSSTGKTYAVHKDIKDEDQTIYVPGLKTTALDKETNTHMSLADKDVTIVDTVSYSNLKVGQTYVVNGTLMDKSTGKELEVNGKPVTATTSFLAEKESGTVELSFTFDGSKLAGKSTVVFESLISDGKEVGSHKDIKDEGQTVQIPKIGTTATVNGSHTATAKKITLVDKVKYSNLIKGKKYTVSGTLMDKDTGKAIKVNGKEVTATKTFTATKSDGYVNLSFTFDASALTGKTVVAFEEVSIDKKVVAVHKDIKDAGQSVKITKPGTKTSGSTPSSSNGTDTKTGQSSNMPIVIGVIAAIVVAGVVVFMKKKNKKED